MNGRWLFCDMDGTLADSLALLRRLLADFLREAGRDWDETLFARLNGAKLDELVAAVREAGVIGSAAEVRARYLDLLDTHYLDVPPAAGAAELLDWAEAQGWQLALTTAAEAALAEAWLRRLGWRERFRFVCGGDAVRHAKPAPDLYRLALARSGAASSHVLVLEDAPHGVTAATAAGLPCWRIGDTDRTAIRCCPDLPAVLQHLQQMPAQAWCLARGQVQVHRIPAPEMSQAEQQRRQQAWHDARTANPGLWNGPALLADSWQQDQNDAIALRAYAAGYADWFTCRDRPTPVATVAVMGAVRRPDGRLLAGLRRQGLSSWGGHWELVPGGVLEPDSDPERHVCTELAEESGLHAESVRCLGLIYDGGCPAWNVALRLDVSTGAQAVSGPEHDDLRWLLPEEIRSDRAAWVPTALACLDLLEDACPT
ncbi:MAG: HAD-IA family hydrolase [Planctomycetota bacterium]